MEKAVLDKIVELVQSSDEEHHKLAQVMFAGNNPTSADYIYLESYYDLFADSVPEEFIEIWGHGLRKERIMTKEGLFNLTKTK